MIQLVVDEPLLNFFQRSNLFQKRYHMRKLEAPVYLNRFQVGETLTFSEDVVIEEFATFASGNRLFSAGMFSSLASSLVLGSKVGRYTSLAGGLKELGFRHPVEAVGMSSVFYDLDREFAHYYFEDYELKNGSVTRVRVPTPQKHKAPVEIGNDVWIGRNVTLSGGIKIGDGAVVASGSVVTKDVLPYSVVAGIPAIHRKWRFPEDIRESLLASSWWDYELGDMYKEGLDFSNPVLFVDQFHIKRNNLRKTNVKEVPLLQYSIFGENYACWSTKNVLIDHQNKALFIKKTLDNFSLVTASPKKAVSDDLLPILVKECTNGNFLYVEKLGYIDINHDFSVVLHRESYEIQSTKITYLQDKSRACISVNNKYLSPQIKKGYKLKPYIKQWETFLLPLHLKSTE